MPDRDEDLKLADRALARAVGAARQLSERTGTPFYVLKDGRVVDLNPQPARAYLLREGRKQAKQSE
ncbi:MAG: hypothetical protein HY318_00015 [Armatimonadetes bacterium]|nr:hypothetical protein [Armatimonadota bacterium]